MLKWGRCCSTLAAEWRSCSEYARSCYSRLTGKTCVWTVGELYDRTTRLSDENLKELADCHIEVVTKMLKLLPRTCEYEEDRSVLEWLLGQLTAFPGARICTIATVECERIRKTGVFDDYIRACRAQARASRKGGGQ